MDGFGIMATVGLSAVAGYALAIEAMRRSRTLRGPIASLGDERASDDRGAARGGSFVPLLKFQGFNTIWKWALAGAAFAAFSGPAVAGTFYAGGDYQWSELGYPKSNALDLPQHAPGYDFHAGYRLNRFLGAEVGYVSAEGGANGNRLGYEGATLDGFVYLPLFHGRFEPFLTAGGAWISAHALRATVATDSVGAKITTETPLWSGDALRWRVGVGIESMLFDHASVRATARYSGGGLSGRMGDEVTIGLGLNIFF